MSGKALDDLRRDLLARRKDLRETSQQLDRLSTDSAEFKNVTKKMLSQYASLMEKLYGHIDKLSIMNYALKEQIEILKDIILQLPDVKTNPEMLRNIERLFRQYALPSNFWSKLHDRLLKLSHMFFLVFKFLKI